MAPAESVTTEAPASSQSNVSTQVMPPGFVFNILLVSANSGLEAEIVEAWQADGKESGDPYDYALVHYSFERAHDVLVVLDLLDRIRLGFFHSVFIVPPASSWSRARHSNEPGQLPLRTRSQPLGVIQATPEAQARLEHENRSLDFVLWFAEQALRCEVVRVPMVLTFPEDFGGDRTKGPSSLWCMQEIRDLEGLHEARRGAGFLCQLAGADQRRPLGILCNLPALHKNLILGWPAFSQVQEFLEYTGPLPKVCPCKVPHIPMVGVTVDHRFNSSGGTLFGVRFWQQVFSAIRSGAETAPVTEEEKGRAVTEEENGRTISSRLGSCGVFSVSSSSFSWSSLYSSWAAGKLSLAVLREFSTSERAGDFCSLEAQGDLWRFRRSNLIDHCRISTSAAWSSLAATLARSSTTSAILARPGCGPTLGPEVHCSASGGTYTPDTSSAAQIAGAPGTSTTTPFACTPRSAGTGTNTLGASSSTPIACAPSGAWAGRVGKYLIVDALQFGRAPDCLAVEGKRWPMAAHRRRCTLVNSWCGGRGRQVGGWYDFPGYAYDIAGTRFSG